MAGDAGSQEQELNGAEVAADGELAAARDSAPSRRVRRIRTLVTAALAGAVTGLVGLVVVTAISNRGRLPELTPERFYAAKEQWAQTAPPDYDITVVVSGRQAATYHAEIRGGQVVVATRNDIPLKQQRTRGTWSVPGMFGTMQSDVDNLEKHQAGTADAMTPQLKLRAWFEPQYGYPARYQRTELRKFGNNYEVSWEVSQFETPPRRR